MSDDLKPCPFCGQEAPGLHLMTIQATHMTSKRHAYFCESCQCCGPEGDTVEEARELWNRLPTAWLLMHANWQPLPEPPE